MKKRIGPTIIIGVMLTISFILITDTSLIQKVRDQIPVSKQRRTDLYDTLEKN